VLIVKGIELDAGWAMMIVMHRGGDDHDDDHDDHHACLTVTVTVLMHDDHDDVGRGCRGFTAW
jgi:hypothetical protein